MNLPRSLQPRPGWRGFWHIASDGPPRSAGASARSIRIALNTTPQPAAAIGVAALLVALAGCSGPPRASPAPLEASRPASPPLVARLRMPMIAASAPAALPQPVRTSPLIPAEAVTATARPPAAAASSATPPSSGPGAPLPGSPPAATQPTALPYAAAVAARFPEPAVSYTLPSLAAGRVEFTTHAEVQTLLRSWVRDAGSGPDESTVRLLSIGVSQAGTPIEGLLFTRSRNATPEGLLMDRRPTVVLVAQQSADQAAAGEALLVIAAQLARGPLQALLGRINVVLVPRANPDPLADKAAAAVASSAVERDHLLLRTPEARALAQLVRNYRATVVLDLQEYPVGGPYVEKFGAVQRFDALLQQAMTGNLNEFVNRAAEEWFRQPLVSAFGKEGLTSEWYHTASTARDERQLSMGSPRPDSLRNVSGLKNAVSLMVASRGGSLGRTHFLRRVHTQVIAASSVLNSAAQRAPDLLKLRQFVDADTSAQACRGQAVLDARTTPSEYAVLMLDPLTGADRSVTAAWDSALALMPGKTRSRPCGYWIAADQFDAVQRLREFGLSVAQVAEAGAMTGESYRPAAAAGSPPTGARGSAAASGGAAPAVTLAAGAIDVSPGSYYLPLTQPLANLAIAVLEPDAPYSYQANGIVTRLAGVARVTRQPDPRLFAAP